MDQTMRPLVVIAAFASSLLVVLLVLLWMLGGLRSVTAPAAIGGSFQLTDQTGQTVTEKDLQGKPTLIFFGQEDRTVGPHQGWMHYRALQQSTETPVRFLLFPGEGHDITQLTHQRRKIQEEIAWFEKYLFRDG